MLSLVSKYRRYFSFIAVGGISTVLHAGIVIALVELFDILPTIANFMAFFAANIFSYFANSTITFSKSRSFIGYGRFFIISLVTLVMVVGITAAGDALNVNYLISLTTVLVTIPMTSYLLMSKFAFADHK